MPGETMPFVSVDVWSLIMTWGNLIILYFIVKKLLFKPVNKMLQDRENEIQKTIDDANTSRDEAHKLEEEYKKHLENAKEEAGEIVKTAQQKAQVRSEEIIRNAQQQASMIMKKADEQIEKERISALEQTKGEISEIAVMIAEKVVKKDLTNNDHERMIEEIIDNLDK